MVYSNYENGLTSRLPRSLVTDSKRLRQVLKNLLSNAFKFTEEGGVRLSVSTAASGCPAITQFWVRRPRLSPSKSPIRASAFPSEKQRIIFEAFQQADAGASRKYGGTGLEGKKGTSFDPVISVLG